MVEGSFSIKELAAAIVRILGAQEGEILEILHDRSDPNRVMVIRHGQEQGSA